MRDFALKLAAVKGADEKALLSMLALFQGLLSTLVLSCINIGISGHLLGAAFRLKRTGSNHFRVRLPFVFNLEIKGESVIAGFCAFSLSLMLVGIFLSEFAQEIFVQRLQATDSRWSACLSLAAGISVTSCLLLGAVRANLRVMLHWVRTPKRPAMDPEERVRRLIAEKPEG